MIMIRLLQSDWRGALENVVVILSISLLMMIAWDVLEKQHWYSTTISVEGSASPEGFFERYENMTFANYRSAYEIGCRDMRNVMYYVFMLMSGYECEPKNATKRSAYTFSVERYSDDELAYKVAERWLQTQLTIYADADEEHTLRDRREKMFAAAQRERCESCHVYCPNPK